VSDQLREQIEFYFSDSNMERDFYLRRQMTSEGYVPLILLSGFARVRSLAPMDVGGYGILGMVTQALALSERLELDESKTKVRRRKGWQRFVLPDATPELGLG
jgi:la-related protein 1